MPELIYIFTTFAIGLFAGALLTEACVFVPYWRRMQASEFFRLHGSLAPGLFRFFAPLTTLAVTMAVLAAGIAWATTGLDINRVIVAAICVVVLALFFGYFRAANRKFAEHSITETELPDALSQWAAVHWLRTVLIVCAFLISLTA